MMMPKKKKRTILIACAILVLAIISIILLLLYLNTDMFKSNKTLFAKYIGKNTENFEQVYANIINDEYEELLKQNKYTNEYEIKVNCTENLGTTAENTQNSINQLKLKGNGQVDLANEYNYQDITLLNNDEKMLEVEYIQDNNTYGIRFSDLFKQYLLVENANLKELVAKLGYTEEQLANIPDTIEFNNKIGDVINFTPEEKENLQSKYVGLLGENISNESFSKQANQSIQINSKDVNTNVYTLTLAKEQLNNIYIKILEQLKQDEILLAKLDGLQSYINQYNIQQENIDIKNQFTTKIDETISEINKNNIGMEETQISVYESNEKTVKTLIKGIGYEIELNWLSSDEEEYAQLIINNSTQELKQIVTLKVDNKGTNIVVESTQNDEAKILTLSNTKEVNGNDCTKVMTAKYENVDNRVETTINQKYSIKNQLENQIVLNDENSILLNTLEENQLQELISRVSETVIGEVNTLNETINQDDFIRILEIMDLYTEEQIVQNGEITETEKNRFNTQFEFMVGQELESSRILQLLEVSKNNIIDMEIVSGTELKMQLDRISGDIEIVNRLTEFVEENKDRKYNASIEYNEITGLAEYIVLQVVTKN